MTMFAILGEKEAAVAAREALVVHREEEAAEAAAEVAARQASVKEAEDAAAVALTVLKKRELVVAADEEGVAMREHVVADLEGALRVRKAEVLHREEQVGLRENDAVLHEDALAQRELEADIGVAEVASLRKWLDDSEECRRVWGSEKKRFLSRLRELEEEAKTAGLKAQLEAFVVARVREVEARPASATGPARNTALMSMLQDVFGWSKAAMECGLYGTLRATVGGVVLEPGHYGAALLPVVEFLEGLVAWTHSVVVLACDPQFPAEFVMQAEATPADLREHGRRVETLANLFAEGFIRGALE